uniref:BUD13 homolog n=1 Tax=Anopheles minimus TaxID=112268 RepID=A0A182WDB1_9DIPT
MATKIDQKEYLKRYLSNDKDKKKKKKKKDKKVAKPGNVVIVDDDLDLTELQRRMDADETDLFGLDEEAPLVVGIIDERPPELRAKEDFSSTKWKAVATNDSFDSMLQQTTRKNVSRPPRSGSHRQRKDSDESPPRRRSKEKDTFRGKAKAVDSDESPPRKPSSSKRRNQDSDESPPRKRNSKERHTRRDDSDASPPRRRKQREDSDPSPPRKHRQNDSDESPPRRREDKASERRKHRRDSEESLPRRHREKERSGRDKSDGKRDQTQSSIKSRYRSNDSDESPPRRKDNARKESSNRRRNSDESPPRRSRFAMEGRDRSRNSPTNDRRRNDSDESPPRRRGNAARDSPSHRNSERRPKSSRTTSPPVRIKQEKNRSDSDLSPPRKSERRQDSDESPPRRKASQRRFSKSPDRHIKRESSHRRDYRELEQRIKQEPRSPSARRGEPPERMSKTLDGKRAGLQDAKALREENEKHRARERAALMGLSDDVSGRYAETVVRDKSGRRRDVEKELREELTKRKQEEKKKEIYTRWGKGVKQTEEYNAQLQAAAYEMEKPLARYADDKDLDEYLKQQERDGDPMLEYLRNKQREENKRAGIPEKPIYQGTFPDNRFGLRPGYRWDGVDRSNGFEKRWFETASKKKAVEEEAYKYSVEDM